MNVCFRKKVFIDCSSPKDADTLIQIVYNECSSTAFYIGDVCHCWDEAMKKANEDIEYDDNGYPTNIPEDVSEWANKLQNLCAELVQLEETFNTLDALCADINSNGWSKHWSL